MAPIVVMGRSVILMMGLLGAGAACVVGPQYDPPAQPVDESSDFGGRGDVDEEPGVEGEAEEPPPGVDMGFLPDDGDGDPWSGEGDDGPDDGDASGEDLEDQLVPGIPPIPRPGPPSPLPSSGPLDSADAVPGQPSPDCDDGESNPRLPAT